MVIGVNASVYKHKMSIASDVDSSATFLPKRMSSAENHLQKNATFNTITLFFKSKMRFSITLTFICSFRP